MRGAPESRAAGSRRTVGQTSPLLSERVGEGGGRKVEGEREERWRREGKGKEEGGGREEGGRGEGGGWEEGGRKGGGGRGEGDGMRVREVEER